MKKVVVAWALGLCSLASAQTISDSTKTTKGRLYGSFETNAQWYLNDKGRELDHPEDPVRSNSYVLLNYQYGRFTAGIQAEAYEANALLNYNPEFKGTNLGLYFARYESDKLTFNVGHFYEQFGSGMILRAWEDRALGINTALRGARIVYRPSNHTQFTALYGQQRSGFDVSDGQLFGADAKWDIGSQFNWMETSLDLGLSYVGRQEDLPKEITAYDELTHAVSARVNWAQGEWYGGLEVSTKSKDGVLNAQNQLVPHLGKSGNAVLFNLGYMNNGLGIDATWRRVENMLFLSERVPTAASDGVSTNLNYNDKIIGFVPSLTKQHHSNLANIYVFQSQNRVEFNDPTIMKAGETGGQIDLYYQFQPGTSWGGKYGTYVAMNFSSWYNLPGQYRLAPMDYDTEFLGVGEKYFSDLNVEVKKKFNETWHGAMYYVTQDYNKRWMEGGSRVKTHIVDAEVTYNFTPERSLRIEAEHMWADADKKNWAGATVEFTLNQHLSFYFWDIYNYGNDAENMQTHYYNVGGAYRKGASRLGLNYGRQRGGLVCVGGVCRYVPESTGLSLSFSTAF